MMQTPLMMTRTAREEEEEIVLNFEAEVAENNRQQVKGIGWDDHELKGGCCMWVHSNWYVDWLSTIVHRFCATKDIPSNSAVSTFNSGPF